MDSVAEAVIGNEATSTINYVLGYLKRQYDYVSNLEENWVNLEKEKEYLCAKEADVTNSLKKDEKTMEKTVECTIWLTDVKKMKAKLEELRKKDENTCRCFCGLCPFHSLLKLGKDVVTYTKEVTALYNRLQQINRMVKREKAPPIRVIMKHPKKIDDVPSLNDHVEKLLKWLKGDNFKRLRIWGLPGVGKTTIMKNLNDRVRETQQFDIVLFVDVSEAKSMGEEMREVMSEEIQEQLVERLQLEAQSDQIPDEISKNLVNNRYLLLLDGVYSEINLNDIGIRDNHKHGKVVFATRYRKVYRSSTDEEINITRLSENDGQNLFKKLLGDIEVDQPDIQPIVKSILRECGGMPQVIMIIANMLRDMLRDENYLALWRDVLCQLQVPSMDPMGELEEVYKAFKTVYDRLNRTYQPCLRYWTIFPPDYEVHEDYITECWKAEEFLARAETLGNARDQGQRIFYELEDKSLLEKGRKARHFKMPVFLQRMVVRIRDQEEKDKFLVGEGGNILEGEELLEKWQSAERVSLIRQKRTFTLPQRPACSKISTLLLQKNPNLTEIPESFFESMCDLRILDLCKTGIMSMPLSISKLKKLRLLYLNNCGRIVELPPDLQQLKSLEILDVRNTGILTLPKEIGQLTGLKCLRVSFKKNCSCSNGRNGQPLIMIPSNVIASLSSLEELSIDVDFKNKIWNQIVDRVAGEVAELRKLGSLCFYFPELTCFETFIEARNRNYMEQEDHGLRFRIVVGNHNIDNFLGFDFFGYTTERHLRFSAGGVIPNAFSNVLEQGYALELIGHHSAKNLSVLGAANLKGLKVCTIEECDEMESIIGGESGDIVTGPLQELHLINLPKLVSIWEDLNNSRCLDKITTLTLQGCSSLERLFPQALVQRLFSLKDLQVKDCSMIEEIIERRSIGEIRDCSEIEEIIEGRSIGEIRALPKLKNVVLCNLPILSRICDEDAKFKWLSLETMKIQTCPGLQSLPFNVENATSLRVIECTKEWWSQLNDSVQDRLNHLHSFT